MVGYGVDRLELALRAPTPAQQQGSRPRVTSVWVTANAGTGKTRVLSDRVLRLLLEDNDPEGILCLTFTKAAAAEMTARIEERLAAWATTADDADLAAELLALTGAPADQGAAEPGTASVRAGAWSCRAGWAW